MALRFIDSFAHTSAPERKWTSVSLNSWQSSGGRRNAPYMKISSGSLLKTLTHGTRLVAGAAVAYISGRGANLVFYNNSRSIAQLFVNDDATISLKVGNNVGTPSNNAVPDTGSWHYYEMDCTVSGGTGPVLCTATIRVDEKVYGTFTGTGDVNGSELITGTADINVAGVASNGTLGFHDYYCLDHEATDINGNATTCTAFLGDVEIDALFPDADVTVNWGTVGGDGTNAYTCIDEHTPNDDTDYIITSATLSAATFNHEPITGFTGTIVGAQYVTYARKDSEGLRAFVNLVGSGTATTVESLGADNYLSDYYIYYCSPLDTDNGVAWTTAVYNAEAFGVKLTI